MSTGWDGEKIELLPCPFCGTKPKLSHIGNEHTPKRKVVIRCPNCRIERTVGAIRHNFAWIEQVIAAHWNARMQAKEDET